MIVSCDDTTASVQCDDLDCLDEYDVTISTLEAGIAPTKDAVYLGVCANGHANYVLRTWENPKVGSGIINALHEALVDAGKSNTTWKTELEAETAGQKPVHVYTLSATAIDNPRGDNGEWQDDLDAIVTLLGVDRAKGLVTLGHVIPDRSDEDCDTWVAALWAGETDRHFAKAKLKINKDLAGFA
jgi:hypothetical protein